MIPEVAQIAQVFRLPEEIGEAQLKGAAHAANQTLKQLVGATALTAAEAQAAESDATTEVLKLAGAYFGMYWALPVIAARIRQDGQVITESGEIARTLRFATAAEVETYRTQLWETGISLLKAIPDLLVIESETEYAVAQREFNLAQAQPADATSGYTHVL